MIGFDFEKKNAYKISDSVCKDLNSFHGENFYWYIANNKISPIPNSNATNVDFYFEFQKYFKLKCLFDSPSFQFTIDGLYPSLAAQRPVWTVPDPDWTRTLSLFGPAVFPLGWFGWNPVRSSGCREQDSSWCQSAPCVNTCPRLPPCPGGEASCTSASDWPVHTPRPGCTDPLRPGWRGVAWAAAGWTGSARSWSSAAGDCGPPSGTTGLRSCPCVRSCRCERDDGNHPEEGWPCWLTKPPFGWIASSASVQTWVCGVTTSSRAS